MSVCACEHKNGWNNCESELKPGRLHHARVDFGCVCVCMWIIAVYCQYTHVGSIQKCLHSCTMSLCLHHPNSISKCQMCDKIPCHAAGNDGYTLHNASRSQNPSPIIANTFIPSPHVQLFAKSIFAATVRFHFSHPAYGHISHKFRETNARNMQNFGIYYLNTFRKILNFE